MLIREGPLIYRRRAGVTKPRKAPPAPPVGPPPVLVSVDYEPDQPGVNLVFDRDIDIAAIDVAAFVVADPNNGLLWNGLAGTAFLPAPNWVQVQLAPGAAYAGSDTLLSVAAGGGIVAEVGGGAWAGVTDLELPFP